MRPEFEALMKLVYRYASAESQAESAYHESLGSDRASRAEERAKAARVAVLAAMQELNDHTERTAREALQASEHEMRIQGAERARIEVAMKTRREPRPPSKPCPKCGAPLPALGEDPFGKYERCSACGEVVPR